MPTSFETIDSRSELLECLRKSQPSVLLGGDDEAARDFYIGNEPGCAVGVCSQGHGVKPSRLLNPSLSTAWVGYNLKVANVDLRACRTNFVVELNGVFFSFIGHKQDGSVIVIHELGACCIAQTGKVVWFCDTDVVVDFADEPELLRLKTDAGDIIISKGSGEKL